MSKLKKRDYSDINAYKHTNKPTIIQTSYHQTSANKETSANKQMSANKQVSANKLRNAKTKKWHK